MINARPPGLYTKRKFLVFFSLLVILLSSIFAYRHIIPNQQLFNPNLHVNELGLLINGYPKDEEFMQFNKLYTSLNDTLYYSYTSTGIFNVMSRTVYFPNIRDSTNVVNFINKHGGDIVSPWFKKAHFEKFFVQGRESKIIFECTYTHNNLLTFVFQYPAEKN